MLTSCRSARVMRIQVVSHRGQQRQELYLQMMLWLVQLVDQIVPTLALSMGATKHMLDSQAVWGWLQKWYWGKMSAIDVQKEALNNHSDYQRMLNIIPPNENHMPSSMQQFAQLGTRGAHPGNVNKELKHWLGEPTMPKAMTVAVPLATQKPKTGEPMTKDVQFPILLPHEMISHVYHNHQTLFSS